MIKAVLFDLGGTLINNEHAGEIELMLPSGAEHIWMDTSWGVMGSSHWKNASKYNIYHAVNLTADDLTYFLETLHTKTSGLA